MATTAKKRMAERDGGNEGSWPLDMEPHELGRQGERAASELLRRKGYEILDRNWSCPAGEVDIVAMDGECLVFIEVKTRYGTAQGLPEEAVTPRKQSRYERIAGYYLAYYDGPQGPVRFDVIGIQVLPNGRAFARHILGAFNAEA